MAYVQHNRLTILGDFYYETQLETWAMNINFGGDLSVSPATPGENSAIASALDTWWESDYIGDNMTQETRLIGFKWNCIKSDGHYLHPEDPNTVLITPNPGASANPPLRPPQIAVAVTFQTEYVGKSYTGRVYMPYDYANLIAGYKLHADTVNGIANNFATLLGNLNDALGTGGAGKGEAIVASSKGFNTPITSVRVGNRLDTQRRRRRGLQETYTSHAVS